LGFSTSQTEFVETFFRKGAEFASQMIQELDTLKIERDHLASENASLRHQLASDDAIRDLLTKIDMLEQEKRRLQGQAASVVEESESYAERYAEVEQELNTMASLYVALYQLHATLSPPEVLGVIEQLLAQFIGAGSFVIYLRRETDTGPVLVPAHAYHCNDAVGTQIGWNEGPVGEAATTKVHSVAAPSSVRPGDPLACIPMVIDDETIGVISIMGFFEQKTDFVDMDFEFFKLLAIHSASAIVASGLMARDGSIGSSLETYDRL